VKQDAWWETSRPEISNSEEGLRAFIIQDFDFWNAAIAAILAEAQEKGEIPATTNPKEVASYILNSYQRRHVAW
jgi:hypothetical protein